MLLADLYITNRMDLRIELKWGLIISVAALMWLVFEYVAGLHSRHIEWHSTVTMFWIPVAIGLLVVALGKRKRASLNTLSYWEGVRSGAIIALVIAVVTPLMLWIFVTYINPTFFENMIRFATTQTGLSVEEASGNFNYRSYAITSVLGSTAGTVLTAMVAMVFMRAK